jgi:hypothetical protein
LGKFEANKKSPTTFVWLRAKKLNKWLMAARRQAQSRPRASVLMRVCFQLI